VRALGVNWAAGSAAIVWLDTAGLITLSAMGAAALYVLSMEALVRLRRSEPDLERPFRAPLFPWLPRLAQLLAAAVLAAMLWQNGSRDRPWASPSAFFLYAAAATVVYYVAVLRPRLAKGDAAAS
jgi:ethanolamine permease